MDFHRFDECERARGPIALWMLAVLIGVVLGTAALAAAFTTDSRDFAARHQAVHGRHAL